MAQGDNLSAPRVIISERPLGSLNAYPKDVERDSPSTAIRPTKHDNPVADRNVARGLHEIDFIHATIPLPTIRQASFGLTLVKFKMASRLPTTAFDERLAA